LILTLLIIHCLVWFGVFGFVYSRNRGQMPRLVPANRAIFKKAPKVSVLIPARDEEVAIKQCVESLLAQDYPNIEIIVANDRSTDRTGEILQKLTEQSNPHELKVLNVPEPPNDWVGKCHALCHASHHISEDSEWLLFMDADVCLEEDTIRRAVWHSSKKKSDLTVVLPHLICVSFWENVILSIFFHMGMISMKPKKIQEPGEREFIGIGAFTLLRRKVYDAFGGHEAIRSEVIDDMALGMMTKDTGGRILITRGRKAVYLRMYDSLQSIVLGFQKNVHAGIGGGLLRSVFVAGIFLIFHLVPLVALLTFLVSGKVILPVFALTIYVLTGFSLYQRLSPANTYQKWAVILGYPVGSVLSAYIILRSAWFCHIRKEIHWRGRVTAKTEQKVKIFGR